MITHTYVLLELSPAAFDEVKQNLEAAGYQHAFHHDGERQLIDMHGLAVAEIPSPAGPPPQPTEKAICRHCRQQVPTFLAAHLPPRFKMHHDLAGKTCM